MKNRLKGNFTQVPNSLIMDARISAQAKGVYIYLHSRDEDWQFYESEIVNNFTNGKYAISVAVKELIHFGYLLRIQKRVSGKFSHYDWILNPTEKDLSEVGKTETQLTETQLSDIGKLDTNNTNNNNTNNNNTKSNKREVSFSDEIEKTFEAIVELFPKKTRPSSSSARNKWKSEIKKLNEIDKLTFFDVVSITKWAREDSFWSTNFLSFLKLRKKNKEDVPYFVIFAENMKSKTSNQNQQEPEKKLKML